MAEKEENPREVPQYGYLSEHGRSSFFVDCPFCGEKFSYELTIKNKGVE